MSSPSSNAMGSVSVTDKPQLIALADLVAAAPTDGLIWTLPPLSAIVRSRFPQRQIHWPQLPPAGTSYLIAIGGGELIDRAKLWRASDSPATTVVAIPSLWGAGAEASPVAILNHGDQKTIHMGLQYVPDLRSTWPELSASIPDDIARYACGDVWAHALESFVSPLGDEDPVHGQEQDLRITLGPAARDLGGSHHGPVRPDGPGRRRRLYENATAAAHAVFEPLGPGLGPCRPGVEPEDAEGTQHR